MVDERFTARSQAAASNSSAKTVCALSAAQLSTMKVWSSLRQTGEGCSTDYLIQQQYLVLMLSSGYLVYAPF
jgi:hypothetical protein